MMAHTKSSSQTVSQNQPPYDYLCAKTKQLMVDPVMTIYGHNYERTALVDWFARGNTTCPITDKLLTMNDIISNHNLRFKISCWLEQQQEQDKKAPKPNCDKDDSNHTTTSVLSDGSHINVDIGEDEDEEDDDRYWKNFGIFVDLPSQSICIPTNDDKKSNMHGSYRKLWKKIMVLPKSQRRISFRSSKSKYDPDSLRDNSIGSIATFSQLSNDSSQ